MEELVFAVPTEELWKLIAYRKEGLIKGNSEILKSIVQNGLFSGSAIRSRFVRRQNKDN
jgi:hypothetical protein